MVVTIIMAFERIGFAFSTAYRLPFEIAQIQVSGLLEILAFKTLLLGYGSGQIGQIGR